VVLEYSGTRYAGSQYQENGRSIQAELECAVHRLTGVAVRAAFAGRTDAGVHAIGQVAAFNVDSALPIVDMVSGLNHFLPEDIAVRRATDLSATFDPRRDAQSRRYLYRINNGSVRSPLLRDRLWHVPKRLDVHAMRAAAARLEGRHDFAAFAGPYEGETVRTLRRCEIGLKQPLIGIEMEAEAFLPHQVRRTVGAMVEVALGRKSEEWLVELLETAVPSSAGPSAPACGLYLVSIAYDGLDLEGCQAIGWSL
jgi:tRNA pseudouridine38-40 synthase